jgi:hypothetical protein
MPPKVEAGGRPRSDSTPASFPELPVPQPVDTWSRGMHMQLTFEDCPADFNACAILIQAVKCTKGRTLDFLTEHYDQTTKGKLDPSLLTVPNWMIDAP